MNASMTPWVVAGVCLIGAVVVQAGQQPQAVFRSAVDQVRLDVLAHDGGKPIPGLTADDFEVRDNGVLVTDLRLTHTDDRVSVAVALDISGSVAVEFMDEMLTATEELVNALRPDDTAWLLTFGGHLELRAGPVSDRRVLREALTGLLPGGGTSLWDALFGAMALAGDRTARSLALVFSDGHDTTSWASEDRMLDTIRRSDVVFSIIRPRHAISAEYSAVSTFLPLERAAMASGGVILKTERGTKLDRQFVNLLNEFRQGYVLSYSATGIAAKANGWHEVEVSLKQRKGRVRARPGYFEQGR
jgi:Ca-activated chloride channel family protein